mmetsp:Transcript_26864/g.100913  ORF Transcript_26864/g.100913 Transcript_26864/m.100913 type:complete len:218 (+) Transcript_26864:599-1252(+)
MAGSPESFRALTSSSRRARAALRCWSKNVSESAPRARAAPRALATATCKGVATQNCVHWFTAATAATIGAGPTAHPTFQPVTDSDFPADPRVSVRSSSPGCDATGRKFSWSKQSSSYTSSATITQPPREAISGPARASALRSAAATASRSALPITRPVGLWGVLTTMALVLGEMAAARASASTPNAVPTGDDEPLSQPGRCSDTLRTVPRAISTAGA